MMTFVFSWGRTDIEQEFRQFEIAKLDQETMDSMIEDVDKVISDYKVTSAERYKHINNEANAWPTRLRLSYPIAGLHSQPCS